MKKLWRQQISCLFTEGYDHMAIDNCDEAGLFFHMLFAVCLMGEKCADGKPSMKKKFKNPMLQAKA
jgi:hypothetical protein